MKLVNSFEVGAPVDAIWPMLNDVPRIAPCLPGAEILEIVDEVTYRAKVTVKIGPFKMSYAATVVVESSDHATKTAVLGIVGNDVAGKGGVRATVISTALPQGDGTRIVLETDAQIAGILAKLGGKLIEGAARGFVAEFATNFAKLV